MAIVDAIHQAWIAHCKDTYPREFAYFEPSLNHLVRLKTEIQNNIMLTRIADAHRHWTSCYITVYGFEAWHGRPQNAIVDRVYIDLDHHANPQIAIDDAIKLIDGLERHGIQTTQYFSGKKGVAIYIDFEPVLIAPENKKETIAAFQHILMERFDLKLDKDGGTMDSHVIGDINRVSRLPNTRHQSSGMYCVPVTLEELKEGIGHIKHLARKPRDLPVETHNNAVMPDYLRRLEQQGINDREKHRIIGGLERLKRTILPNRGGGKSKDENVANKLIATLKRTGHLSHNQRVGLVCLLDKLGLTQHEINRLFLANASDAGVRAGDVTRYQVDHVLDWKRRR